MIQKFLSIFLFTCVIALTSAHAQDLAPNDDVEVSLTIGSTQGNCILTPITMLDFGTLYRPASGTATATFNASADTPDISYTPGDDGNHTIGSLRVNGTNVSAIAVTVTYPTNLKNGAATPVEIALTPDWAVSDDDGSSDAWTAPSFSLGVSSTTFTTGAPTINGYMRFGGAVTIAFNQDNENDPYKGEIDVEVTCTQAS